MVIVLAIYAAFVWLIFFQFKILPWNTLTKIVVSIVGLVILLTFMGLLNSRTPSGRVTVMSPVVEVAPAIGGTIAEVPVKTYQVVKHGDVLFSLDRRPFQYLVQQAQASYDIAEVSYLRIKTAMEKSAATFSRQQLDQARAQFEGAEAALEIAKYNLDRATVTAIGDGVVGTVRLRVGDRITAFKPILPMIRTGQARIWGVFSQNGRGAIKVGTDIGIALSSEPGVVRWTRITGVSQGTAGGQVSANARLLGQKDFGDTDEVVVVMEWPEGLEKDRATIGSVGAATVIGPDSGAIGSLASILLRVKAIMNYL